MLCTVYKKIFQDCNDIFNDILNLNIDDTRCNIKDEFDIVNDIFNTGKAAYRKC